ncbi:MAG: alkaline phosphatase PhoX, partial [Ginsengibacter sp.]
MNKHSCQCFLIILLGINFRPSQSQTIGTFSYVAPGTQSPSLVLPTTHTFQRIIRTGDILNDATMVAANLDFTAYVPISGSSTAGYLSVNSETFPAKVAIMNVTYDTPSKLWQKSASGNVAFSTGAGSDLGAVSAFCSGAVTPANTVMIGEESLQTGDANGDGYEDIGWLVEIDPATKSVVDNDPSHSGADKLWAAGRQAHENVTVKSDGSVMYWGADHPTNGYVYKFVPDVTGNYSSGTLYVLETNSAIVNNPGPWTGIWKVVP